MIIYMAVNKINNKKYIGQTVQGFDVRKRQHLGDVKKSKLPFHRAIRKYGDEGFEWQILYHAKSIKELNAMETYYINAYATHIRVNGYNIAFGGGNTRMPLTVRKKLSTAMKGKRLVKPHSMEHRKKLSEANKGKKLSAERRKKISEALKGKINPNFGKHPTAETRARLCNAQAGERNPSCDLKIYTFHHPKYGLAFCTRYMLCKEFSIHHRHLSKLITGKAKSCKGWRIASPEYIQELKKRNEVVSCN